MGPRRASRLLAAAASALAGGCAVGPAYHPATARVPSGWSAPAAGGIDDRPADLAAWWTAFEDPVLNGLVGRALASNPDLAEAEARLREARAYRQLSEADFRPQAGLDGSYTREEISRHQPLFGVLPIPRGFPFDYSVYEAGFDASWELDLFGAKRRTREAAEAQWGAAAEERNGVRVSLAAEVGRDYLELRGIQRRLELARKSAELGRASLELTRARFQEGLATGFEVARAAEAWDELQAAIPALEAAAAQRRHSLAALLRLEPGELEGELSAPAALPSPPPEIPVGLPSDLLRRRPDVRRAERELAAATARVGVAEAGWFPRVSLTGGAGMESIGASEWFEPGSRFWSIGPSLQWPALDFGRVRAEVRARTAAQQAALAAYEGTVAGSLRDAEDALVAYAQERIRGRALSRAEEEDRRTLGLAEACQAEGTGDALAVLEARRALCRSEEGLAASDEAVAVDLVALYKALGGGWGG